MKATKFYIVVTKPTVCADRFVNCWIKFRIAVKVKAFQ